MLCTEFLEIHARISSISLDPGLQGTGILVLGWHLNYTKPSLWRWRYSTVKERKIYILMWCLFFFFLPFHTHFLPFAPPLPPFLVPAIVAPYFQPRGGQAYRQLSSELIASLFCRSSIGMHMSGMIGMFHPQDYQVHHLCNKFSLQA